MKKTTAIAGIIVTSLSTSNVLALNDFGALDYDVNKPGMHHELVHPELGDSGSYRGGYVLPYDLPKRDVLPTPEEILEELTRLPGTKEVNGPHQDNFDTISEAYDKEFPADSPFDPEIVQLEPVDDPDMPPIIAPTEEDADAE